MTLEKYLKSLQIGLRQEDYDVWCSTPESAAYDRGYDDGRKYFKDQLLALINVGHFEGIS